MDDKMKHAFNDYKQPYKFKRFKTWVIEPSTTLTFADYDEQRKRSRLNGHVIKCQIIRDLLEKEIIKNFKYVATYKGYGVTNTVYKRVSGFEQAMKSKKKIDKWKANYRKGFNGFKFLDVQNVNLQEALA